MSNWTAKKPTDGGVYWLLIFRKDDGTHVSLGNGLMVTPLTIDLSEDGRVFYGLDELDILKEPLLLWNGPLKVPAFAKGDMQRLLVEAGVAK